MARMKFLVDTVHPDYGYVSKGDVLKVDQPYVKEYTDLKIAEETDDDYSRGVDDKHDEPPKGWGKHQVRARHDDSSDESERVVAGLVHGGLTAHREE